MVPFTFSKMPSNNLPKCFQRLGSTQFISAFLCFLLASASQAGRSSIGRGGGGRRGQVSEGHLTLGWTDGRLPGPGAATEPLLILNR